MRLKTLALATVLLASCDRGAASDAKLTADEAVVLVTEELVDSDRALVHVHAEPLQPGVDLRAYLPEALGEGTPIEVTSESWLVWIDDEPGAFFDHATRFVLVDCETGEASVQDQRWWPMLDGQALFIDPYVYEERAARSGALGEDSQASAADVTCDGKPGKALVINGFEEGQTLGDSLERGAQDMRAVLGAAGFETTYHGPVGNDGVAGPATTPALEAWFDKAAKELKPGDTLVVYLAGHGTTIDGQVPRNDGWAGGVSEVTLRRWLAKIDECVNVIVMIESCKSGSFVDGLQDSVNLLITSTNKKKSAYADLDRWFFSSDTNAGDKGPEFTSSVNNTLLQTLVEAQDVARLKKEAEMAGQSFWEATFADVFKNSRADDFAEQRGWSCPQSVHGNRGAGKTPVVQAPVCSEPMPDDGTMPDDDGDDDDDSTDPTPQPNSCEALPAAAQADLGRAAALLFGGTPDDAAAQVCTEAMPLPEGNETLHSDGVKIGFAAGEVDTLLLDVEVTCSDTGGFGGCGKQAAAAPHLTAPSPTQQILGDFHCEFFAGDQLLLCPIGAFGLTGDATVITAVMAEPIPEASEEYEYQFGFVFDRDGDPTNNYRGSDAYPADFFDDSDLWFVATYDADGIWRMNVTDARDGNLSTVASNARIIVDGHVITLALPPGEVDPGIGTFRFTAFRHTGDYGAQGEWAGDVVPAVGESLLDL